MFCSRTRSASSANCRTDWSRRSSDARRSRAGGLLLHVVDASHPQAEEQIAAVNSVLNEIGAGEKPTIMVFNKMDRVSGGSIARLKENFRTRLNFCDDRQRRFTLARRTGNAIESKREFLELKIPHEQSAVIARLHKVGQVIERRYNGKTANSKSASPRIITTSLRHISFRRSRREEALTFRTKFEPRYLGSYKNSIGCLPPQKFQLYFGQQNFMPSGRQSLNTSNVLSVIMAADKARGSFR